MKMKFAKYFAFVGLLSLAFSSCIKDEVDELGNAGTAKVKILEAPRRSLFYSPFSDVKTIDLFSLRRDEVSSSDMSQAVSLKITAAPDSVEAYNDANGTSYEVLPDSLYTLLTPDVTKAGDVYTFNIASNTVGKEFTIGMNGAKWDISHKYGMYFIITDPAGKTITSGRKEVFATVEVKNQWDGVYEVTGAYADATNAAFSGIYPYTWELQTLSPTECLVVDNVNLGIPGFTFSTDGSGSDASLSYYGNFGLIVTFDPVTNKVVGLTNYYGQPASNTRSAILDATGENTYDVDSKTVTIKYYMTQPNFVTAPPNIRATFNEKWKYVSARN